MNLTAAIKTPASLPPLAVRLFGIDPRSLAAFRVAFGLILLVDLAWRASDLTAFYADDGMLSIEMAKSYHVNDWHWSLHNLHGSAAYQGGLMVIAGLFAVMLLVGWQTRLATIASWFFACSIATRNPMICNYGDQVLRLFLFWAMFVPLGRCWSLDAFFRQRRAVANASDPLEPIVSMASACILIQLGLLYFFAGVYKWNGDWFSGDAARFALLLDYCGRPFGQRLSEFPGLLRLLTRATLLLELLGALVIWFPWQTARIRGAMIAAFVLMHAGFELCLTPGILSYACVSGWLLFLPSGFWNGLRIAVASVGRIANPSAGNTDGLAIRPTVISAPVDRRIGTAGPLTANPRKSFGQIASAVACGFFLLYGIGWNIASLDWQRLGGFMPERLRFIGYVLHVRQIWDMFYIPSRANDWYVGRGELADGRAIDVLRGGSPVEIDRPREHWSDLPNFRWRFFFRRLSFAENESFRPVVVRYLFDDWNRRHGPAEKLVRLDLQHFLQDTADEPGRGGLVVTSFGIVEAESATGDVSPGLLQSLQAIGKGSSPLP